MTPAEKLGSMGSGPPLSADAALFTNRLWEVFPASEKHAIFSWLETFFRFQQEWLLDGYRFSLLNKSRQIGASHSYAAAACIWSLLGETTTVISIGEREAGEVLDKVRRHASVLHQLGATWARTEATRHSVSFPSTGGRVIALPSTSGGRSYSGNVILDEFAYHERPDKVWDGAAGTVLHGYRLRIISTPNGIGNLWHQLFTDPKAHEGYKLHLVPIDTAREQGMGIDDKECWRMARGDSRVYDQLFRGTFVNNDDQYIPVELVEAATVIDTYCYDGRVYGGLDIGRTNDRTTLVLTKVAPDGTAYVQKIVSRKRTAPEDIERLADFAFQQGCYRLCVDATGMGAFPADNLRRKHGRARVEPLVFTMQLKEDLATCMYQYFADGQVKIPVEEGGLRDDVCSIRRIITGAGHVRYDAPRTSTGHADSAWALAMALHASSQPSRHKYAITESPETGVVTNSFGEWG